MWLLASLCTIYHLCRLPSYAGGVWLILTVFCFLVHLLRIPKSLNTFCCSSRDHAWDRHTSPVDGRLPMIAWQPSPAPPMAAQHHRAPPDVGRSSQWELHLWCLSCGAILILFTLPFSHAVILYWKSLCAAAFLCNCVFSDFRFPFYSLCCRSIRVHREACSSHAQTPRNTGGDRIEPDVPRTTARFMRKYFVK